MVTLQGFVRSYAAAIKRAERNQQKRSREAAKLFRQQQKQNEIANAAEAVKQYDEYIDVIMSVHKDCTDTVDWVMIKNEPKPELPVYKRYKELIALELYKNYNPSLIDKCFSLEAKKRRKLNSAVVNGKEEDLKEHNLKMLEYNVLLTEWDKFQNLCRGIESKDINSYKEIIEYFNPFEEISELGSNLSITFESTYVIVDLHVRNNDVIPNYILSQTVSGKLSKKNMPISKYNELYQDYVCSCILRLSREILAYLPVDFVVLNALSDLLNSSTGHIEEQIILSVLVPFESLSKINFQTIDPSDSMKNFVHNMKFSKTLGFVPVNEVEYKKIVFNV